MDAADGDTPILVNTGATGVASDRDGLEPPPQPNQDIKIIKTADEEHRKAAARLKLGVIAGQKRGSYVN